MNETETKTEEPVFQPNAFVRRLSAVFGAPENTTDIELFLQEYSRITTPYNDTVLSKAADWLIRNGGQRWPTPRQCVDACANAEEELASKASSERAGKPQEKMPWEKNRETARQWAVAYVIAHPLGSNAREEGWERPLRQYAESYAWQLLNAGRELPEHKKWKPQPSVIADFKKYRA